MIRPIYTVPSAEAAQAALYAFAGGPWSRSPHGQRGVAQRLGRVIPFFAFPPAVHKVVCTTNAIATINPQLRRIIRTRGTSRPMRPPPSSSGWHCATSLPIGACCS
ncbi:transposase [Burkholderia latens]|uniref:transposase n=1 Tax=Burkholderia latens TaxID=488446 RepID=UPI00158BE8D9|nr:transposase [Burkholderia latens]